MNSSTNEPNGNGIAEQINALVKRFAAHQNLIGLKDGTFARRFQDYVGSEKTWMLLKAGKWEGHVNADRMLVNLKKFGDRLDGAASFDADSFNKTQPFVKGMDAEFDRLMGAPRDRRCMIALAPEGVGKSWWASAKLEDKASLRFYLRLNHTWREKTFHIAKAMSVKVGAPLMKSPAAQMEALIEMMRSLGEAVFILDEGHNGGVAVFKLLKDLIDETSWRFVYMAFPTEFDLVRSSSVGAMAEARQLFRRSVKPIFDTYRGGIGANDVASFLVTKGFPNKSELKDFSAGIAPLLATNQNLSTLADAFDDAREKATDLSKPVTLEGVRTAVKALCSTAIERRAAEANTKESEVVK